MQITADVSKTLKTFRRDLTFIFDVPSESLLGFVSYMFFQGVENVVSFTKKCFYRKRGSVAMRNYAETFQVTHDYNMEQKFFDKMFVLQKIEICDPNYLMKGNVVLVKVDQTHILSKNRLWQMVMIKVFAKHYPTLLLNHLLLKIKIIRRNFCS